MAHHGTQASREILAMSVILGTGEHRYRVIENWAKLPEGWELMDVGAVACDSKDHLGAISARITLHEWRAAPCCTRPFAAVRQAIARCVSSRLP